MSIMRILQLPLSPIMATAVVVWVLLQPAPEQEARAVASAAQMASADDCEKEEGRAVLDQAPRLSNYSLGLRVAL